KDAEAAKAFAGALATISESLAKHKAFKEWLPGGEKMLPKLLPKVEGSRLTLTLDDKILKEVGVPLGARFRANAERAIRVNSLRQIALAMHDHDLTHKTFPAPAILDAKGNKPLLSWRVAILPFIEQKELYDEFKLDEPWDSPHNKELIGRMPNLYKDPGRRNIGEGKTCYQVARTKGAVFEGPRGITVKEITD